MNSNTTVQENINRYLPLLSEVRRRILFVFSIFLLFGVVGFFYYEKIIVFIIDTIDLGEVNIVFTSPFQFLNLAISSSLLIGTIATIPLLLYQVLHFLKPALKSKEYRSIIAFMPLSIVLFLGGFTFGFFITTILTSLSCSLFISLGAPIIKSSASPVFGKAITSRIDGSFCKIATKRSIPKAIPPCGGAPYLNASIYHLKFSGFRFFDILHRQYYLPQIRGKGCDKKNSAGLDYA